MNHRFFLTLIAVLPFLVLPFTVQAAPALSAVQAAEIAQRDLENRNLQHDVYITEVVYKGRLGKPYWEVLWSKRFPANTEGYNEIGLKIEMDGNYTRTVKR